MTKRFRSSTLPILNGVLSFSYFTAQPLSTEHVWTCLAFVFKSRPGMTERNLYEHWFLSRCSKAIFISYASSRTLSCELILYQHQEISTVIIDFLLVYRRSLWIFLRFFIGLAQINSDESIGICTRGLLTFNILTHPFTHFVYNEEKSSWIMEINHLDGGMCPSDRLIPSFLLPTPSLSYATKCL